MITEHKICRLCKSENIATVAKFGDIPLANSFKFSKEQKELCAPLEYFKCENCHSIQLKYQVNSDVLFKNYNYESPPNLAEHFLELANTTSKFLGLQPKARIMDIGSNNGLALEQFKKVLPEAKVVGFEPAKNIAQKALNKGIPTISEFFTSSNAKLFSLKYKSPDLIICCNCFAHLQDINDFVEGLCELMGNDTIFVFENAYLYNTLVNADVGQFYSEHVFLHSITPLVRFFKQFGLEVFNIEYNKVQMGSFRCYVKKQSNDKFPINDTVYVAVEYEKKYGMCSLSPYLDLSQKILNIKDSLTGRLREAKQQNKTISIFGWPAKMTLLNKILGLDEFTDYIIEESELKVGRYAPGTQLEVKNLEYFKQNPTDICVLGAYNFENDIKSKNVWYNGTWINPLKP